MNDRVRDEAIDFVNILRAVAPVMELKELDEVLALVRKEYITGVISETEE